MSNHKRLFLFALYDQDGIIDDAVIYYISEISKYGDVIVCTDCDCPKNEINKLKPYTIHIIYGRHGEYDFGSYKRAYEYAWNMKILKNYDVLYMLNDSVFGPFIDIKRTINRIEELKTDAAGIVVAKHKTHSYMESWFIRLNKNIFTSKWFKDFILNIQHQERKTLITIKYEHGLTNLIKNNGYSWDGVYICQGRATYNKPKQLFKIGCPFIKKTSFMRHNGALGSQIKYILNHADKKAIKAVIKTANRIYDEKYMKWFLTSNPIKILYRNITYALKKIRNGGI